MGKLLVTGGMGHLGYEIVRRAAAQGRPVVAQVMSTFRDADAQALGPNVVWVRCDLSDPYELSMLAAAHDIDACIHTAAIPNDELAIPQPMQTFRSNIAATQLLLETARRLKWRRFLFVSTGSVFQKLPDTITPIPEDTPPSPVSLYAVTKRSSEMLLDVYARTYGLSAATVRVSWIFGPPTRATSLRWATRAHPRVLATRLVWRGGPRADGRGFRGELHLCTRLR
jgi:nucleoside-diphosphate-sugar epimerase